MLTAAFTLAIAPPAIKVDRDLAFGSHPLQKLDMHYIGETEKNLPVMVYIHGGGWQAGDKSRVQSKPKLFTSEGFVFASINYRLSPRVKHPEHIKDCAAAVAWIVENADKYGIDPGQVWVSGHSAGAHLAGLLAVDPRWLKAEGLDPGIIKGAALIDGAGYEIAERMETNESSRDMYRKAFGTDPAGLKDASPIHNIGQTPPIWFGVAVSPRKIELQVDPFAKALRAQSGKASIFDATHIHTHGSINQKLGEKDPVTDHLLRWVKSVRDGQALNDLEQAPGAPKNAFDRMDRNGDGEIQRSELPESLRARFDEWDKDNSQGLSRAEALAAFRDRN